MNRTTKGTRRKYSRHTILILYAIQLCAKVRSDDWRLFFHVPSSPQSHLHKHSKAGNHDAGDSVYPVPGLKEADAAAQKEPPDGRTCEEAQNEDDGRELAGIAAGQAQTDEHGRKGEDSYRIGQGQEKGGDIVLAAFITAVLKIATNYTNYHG